MTDSELREQDLAADPRLQFERWFFEAERQGLREPQAAALATATPEGAASVRMVLVRRVDDQGLRFFTNLHSRKGRELEANPRAALLFYWDALQRQVRVEGRIEALPPAESDDYFRSRHRGSQISAWTSPQSQTVPDRAALDRRWSEIEERFAGRSVERPPHWGGFVLVPESWEFWQHRPYRFHDRLRYRRAGAEPRWIVERLAP